jgi:hypothetical protein
MQQDMRSGLLRCPERQFEVGSVHRIASLERHDLPPPSGGELASQLCRGSAEQWEVRVPRVADHLEVPRQTHPVGSVQQAFHTGMHEIRGAEYGARFGPPVTPPLLLDVLDGE